MAKTGLNVPLPLLVQRPAHLQPHEAPSRTRAGRRLHPSSPPIRPTSSTGPDPTCPPRGRACPAAPYCLCCFLSFYFLCMSFACASPATSLVTVMRRNGAARTGEATSGPSHAGPSSAWSAVVRQRPLLGTPRPQRNQPCSVISTELFAATSVCSAAKMQAPEPGQRTSNAPCPAGFRAAWMGPSTQFL